MAEILFVLLSFCCGAIIAHFIMMYKYDDKLFSVRHQNANLEMKVSTLEGTVRHEKEKNKVLEEDLNRKNDRIINLQEEVINLREELYEKQMDVESKQ